MTNFLDVYDLSLISFKDYQLNKIYDVSKDDFYNILKGYLIKAITKFTNNKKDLENNLDIANGQFLVDLTLTEQVILSDLTVIEWMSSKILDITQMSLHLNDTDFKVYSEAQNLTAKINAQNILREKIDLDMGRYGIKNINWKDWMAGNYA